MLAETQFPSSRFAPLDVPLVVIASDPPLLDSACAVLRNWPTVTPAEGPELQIVIERAETSSADVSCEIGIEGSRLSLTGPVIYGWADAARGTASVRVPPVLASDPAMLAEQVIDPLLLFLLARSGRVPVHASGIIVGDRLAMLCGPSGSGKSNLALAAARRGLPVLSDDALYVQIGLPLRVWGLPRPLHLYPKDAPSGTFRLRERGGKTKAIVPLDEMGKARFHAEQPRLILLKRGINIGLDRLQDDEAMNELMRLEPGFDLLGTQSEQAFQALLQHGAWRLTLSHNPDEAIALLQDRLPLL